MVIRPVKDSDWDQIYAAVGLWKSLGFEILTTVPEAFEHRQHGCVGLHVMFQSFTG